MTVGRFESMDERILSRPLFVDEESARTDDILGRLRHSINYGGDTLVLVIYISNDAFTLSCKSVLLVEVDVGATVKQAGDGSHALDLSLLGSCHLLGVQICIILIHELVALNQKVPEMLLEG